MSKVYCRVICLHRDENNVCKKGIVYLDDDGFCEDADEPVDSLGDDKDE